VANAKKATHPFHFPDTPGNENIYNGRWPAGGIEARAQANKISFCADRKPLNQLSLTNNKNAFHANLLSNLFDKHSVAQSSSSSFLHPKSFWTQGAQVCYSSNPQRTTFTTAPQATSLQSLWPTINASSQ
jgi:hypothetical protein